MLMAALRGLSFPFRCGFAFAGSVGADAVCWTGRDRWASDSGKLMLAASSEDSDLSGRGFCMGRVSLSWGFGPAMDVSGMPVLRGGSGNVSGRE